MKLFSTDWTGRTYRMTSSIIDIFPYFQPIISMSGKNTYGYEILARGKNDKGELILPKDIFCSNDKDLYIIRDQIVREKAFQIISKLKKQTPIDCNFFFNVPPESFLTVQDIDCESHLVYLCNTYNIPPENIVIEITERNTDRFPEILPILNEYKNLGFILAIDDWGAEQSNFDRLGRIMPDIVKFDSQFLWRATSESNISEIYSSAVSMASKLGMGVIAEGIETIENLYMALEAGCSFVQGFLLDRPAPGIQPYKTYKSLLGKAFKVYRDGKISHMIREKNRIRSYVSTIHNDLNDISSNITDTSELLEKIRNMFDRQADIIKAYVLDPAGVQISPNFIRLNGCLMIDESKIKKDWSWRPYYLETLVNQELFGSNYTITGPYVDPDLGLSVFTVCFVLEEYMMCVDYKNEL